MTCIFCLECTPHKDDDTIEMDYVWMNYKTVSNVRLHTFHIHGKCLRDKMHERAKEYLIFPDENDPKQDW